MNEAERISILAVFQTLKTKTARLLEPIVQAEGLTPLQASVLLQLTRQDAAVGDISEATCMGQANASWSREVTSPAGGAVPTEGWSPSP